MNSEPDLEPPTLYAYEWISVTLIIAFMGMLIFITKISNQTQFSETSSTPHYIVSQDIVVKVEGNVENPGFFEVKKGTSIGMVLEKAIPKTTADLRKIKSNSKVRNGQIIKIPIQEMVTIFVEGEVISPGEYIFPKDTKLVDLIDALKFSSDANTMELKKKRRLRDQETVYIKSKSPKNRNKS